MSCFNPFLNAPSWDSTKYKEAADDNWNVAINNGYLDTDCIENIVEKGEIAHFEQFHPFPQCFPKALFFNVLKWVHMEERVKSIHPWSYISLVLYTPIFHICLP